MLVSKVPASDHFQDPDETRRRELADFLKMKRSALTPEDLGLPTTQRRRSKGLLREEVAHRAGTSLTWYTWLEQGREIQPSPELVERLAQALLLSDTERQHLHALARREPHKKTLTHQAPPALVSWIEGLDPRPAYALNGVWDVIAWNSAAIEMLGDFADISPDGRNLLQLLFLNRHWRDLFVDWTDVATSAVAQFRAAAVSSPEPTKAQALIDQLARESPDFARLWQEGAVAGSEIKVKRIRHPRRGEIALSYVSLRPDAFQGDISVTIYSQP